MTLKNLLLSMALTLSAFAAGPTHARDATIIDGQSTAYQSKITEASEKESLLSRYATCLESFLEDLNGERAAHEKERAIILQEREHLGTEQLQLQGQIANLQLQVDAEAHEVALKSQEYRQARAEREAQQQRLNECIRWLGDGICRAGEAAVISLGWMRDAGVDYRDAEGRLARAQGSLADFQGRLNAVSLELAGVEGRLGIAQASADETRRFIETTSAAAAEMNIQIHQYHIRKDALVLAIKDAGSIDPNSARQRQIDGLSNDLAVLIAETPTFLSATAPALPEAARSQCGI